MRLLGMGLCALLAAGCVEETDASLQADAPPVEHAPAADDTHAPVEAPVVEVRIAESMITMPQATAPAGTISFEAFNDGTTPHALAVRSGAHEYRTEPIQPGEMMVLTVDLPAGSYEVYCPEVEGGNHTDVGERATLVVEPRSST